MATYSFTVRATDNAGAYADRSFSIDVNNTTYDRYVVGCANGIARSPDGLNWTVDVLFNGVQITNVQYGGGKWVAVRGFTNAGGVDANGRGQLYSSVDGTNWSNYTPTITGNTVTFFGFSSVKYRNGKWMAFATGNTNAGSTTFEYYESTDAITWARQSSISVTGASNSNNMVDFDYYNGQWVACLRVLQSTTYNTYLYRTTTANSAATWGLPTTSISTNSQTTAGGGFPVSVYVLNGMWFVIFNLAAQSNSFMYTSYDSQNWTTRTLSAASTGGWVGPVYVNGRLWFICPTNGTFSNTTNAGVTVTSATPTGSSITNFVTSGGITGLWTPGCSLAQFYGGKFMMATTGNLANAVYFSSDNLTTLTTRPYGASAGSSYCVGVRV